ncbi:hypothetical protein HDU76_000761 [Blyttiomyces sp. JEL0837]|nr:hypothetical protein HDU76_000761 [Blyttiomyces sp. JEL0837]
MDPESTYVAEFVRELCSNDVTSYDMVVELEKGVAYSQQDFLAVIADVSSHNIYVPLLALFFEHLKDNEFGRTTVNERIFLKTKLGKLSSEMITQTVGQYMNQIIEVVYFYNGDIVKFLGKHLSTAVFLTSLDLRVFNHKGDALLVTFDSPKGVPVKKEDVILRAVLCCLQILTECSAYEVVLDTGRASGIDALKLSDFRSGSRKQIFTGDDQKTMLYLHVAVTAGSIARVVMGNPSERLDYSINGAPLSNLGTILDGTKAGELGIDNAIWASLFPTATTPKQLTTLLEFESEFVKCSKRACEAIADYFISEVNLPLSNYIKSPALPSKSALNYQQLTSSFESRLAKFVNNSVWKQLMNLRLVKSTRRKSIAIEQSIAGLKSNYTSGDDTVNDEIVVMTARGRTPSVVSDNEVTEAGVSSGPRRLPPLPAKKMSTSSHRKRFHPSILSQPEREAEQSDVGIVGTGIVPPKREVVDNSGSLAMRGEFRMVSVVFVKLHFEFDKKLSQLATFGLLTCLRKYEGVFQQFSVDDKGQTLLSVFGLPPLSHQSEPEQAIKAMVEFVDFAKEYLDGRVTVGVSTGEILFATIGTNSRREASLLGDVVNIAARLITLNSYHGMIVTDEMTHLGSTNIFNHDDIGEHHLKGKDSPLRLWTITKPQAQIKHEPFANGSLCGYEAERATLMGTYLNWKNESTSAVTLIEASSGLGKSKLGSFVSNLALADNIPVCLVQGTEIEQRTPYFGMCGVLSFMLHQYRQNSSKSHGGKLEQTITSLGMASREPTESPAPFKRRDSSQSSIRRSSMSSSTARSLTIASTRKGSEANTEGRIHLLARAFMKYCGEDPDMTPLLGMVIPTLQMADSTKTAKLDPQAKANLLKSLILRIFNSFVAKQRCVFVFDDAQWIDEISLGIIFSIVNFSTQEFVLVLSRPIADSNSPTLQRISKHPSVCHIQLKGLRKMAIQDLISQRFLHAGYTISAIADDLLDAIVQKGNGFPLYADMIATLLQDKLDKDIIIQDGCIRLRDSKRPVDDVLLNTVSAAVISQFDRLSQQFQEILRVASCLGQYFILLDVAEVGGLEITPSDMAIIIDSSDRYNFLAITQSQNENVELDNEAAFKNTPNASSNISCSFRHISIMNAIYESLSYAERSAINLTAARRLEETLTEENQDFVLPGMSFHYSRTKEFDKSIWCLEKLGCRYVQRANFSEGMQTLAKLEEFYATLTDDETATINSLRRARWLAEYAFALAQLKHLKIATSTALEALDLSSITEGWPRVEELVKKKLVRSLGRLLKLWIATGAGRWPVTSPKSKLGNKITPLQTTKAASPDMIDSAIVQERALSAISLVSVYDPTLMPAMSALVMIELLCHVIVRASRDPFYWRLYLARAVILFYFPLKPLAKIFHRRLHRVNKLYSPTRAHDLQQAIMDILILPNVTQTLGLFHSYAGWCESRGDVIGFRTTQVFLGQSALLLGLPFGSAEVTLIKYGTDPTYFDAVWGPTATVVLYRRKLLEGDFNSAGELYEMIRLTQPYTDQNPIFQAVYLLMESYHAVLIKKNPQEALVLFHKAIQKVLSINRVLAIDTFHNSSAFIWSIIDPDSFIQPHHDDVNQINAGSKEELVKTLEDACKLMQRLGVKLEILPCWWAFQIYNSGLEVVKGNGAKAAKSLLQKMKSRRRNEIEEYRSYHVVCCGIIARYSDRVVDKIVYKAKGRELIGQTGAKLYSRWIDP